MHEFSPQRERSVHDALVERARRTTMAAPLRVLCPSEPLAASLEARIARAGGGFVSFVAWEALLARVESTLALPTLAVASPTVRSSLVETALETHAHGSIALAAALRIDPYGIANALLPVLDELRLAGWSRGRIDVIERACPRDDADAATPLVRGHLALLGAAIDALETGFDALDVADVPRRIAAVLAARGDARALPDDELYVQGIDRLAPLERALLERVADGGTRVHVAPWVVGWTRRSPAPAEPTTPPETALASFARSPGAPPAASDDASITELAARDPDEESEEISRWIASLPAPDRADCVVLVPAEPGYPSRVARALARHGVASSYTTREPVQRSPLWQVVRASVRLAWRGADPIDLTTVLSAPGAGIWGADRDRFCARLRERITASWDAVREELAMATDADALARAAARRQGVTDPSAPIAPLEPARIAQLDEERARVTALIAIWDDAGPFARRSMPARHASLRAVVEATLERFANPMRFRESFDDSRIGASWVASAVAIGDAARAVLERFERDQIPLPAADPSSFLAPVERLLGTAPDALNRRRDDVVQILVDTAWPLRRPRTLVALGFARGRYPSPVQPALLLGPLEREALARARELAPGLAEIADEGLRAALAEREARRALSLPTERLLVVWPRRNARGDALEPSLARRDLLGAFPPDVAAARLRAEIPSVRSLRTQAARSPRAALVDAAEALGARGTLVARATIEPIALCSLASRDLFVARFRPDARFAFGALALDALGRGPFSPSALETLLKCRYSFFAGPVLGLRSLTLARTPTLSPGEQAAIAHAALSALEDAALDPDAALEAAIAQRAPWAERGDARLELEEVRRTLRGFLRRYHELRRAFAFGRALRPPARDEHGQRAEVRLAIATAEPTATRSLAIAARAPRVEIRTESVDGAPARGVVVDLRLGGLDDLAKRRDLGLDVTTALAPAIAEQQHAIAIDAVATVSLGRPEVQMLAEADARGDVPRRVGRTFVTTDPARTPHSLRDEALAMLAAEVDAIARDEGAMPPHSRARRAELEKVKARSCEYCAAWLGCRFGDAGRR